MYALRFFMKEISIQSHLTVYQFDELSEQDRLLVEQAKAQVSTSYSPYSHFAVGAAALMANGEIVCGSNQENAAYPSGICAERTTLFYAGARYPDVPVTALAIACYTNGQYTQEPGSPCGACRQVMIECEERHHTPMRILLYGQNKVYVFSSAKELLPLCFVPDDLKG